MPVFLHEHRDPVAVGCALVVPPAACAALIPARAALPNTDAALVLVAFTVAVAAFGNRLAGCLAALGTAVWFDFFLTVPYERFAIDHRADLETTVLLLVGAAVTEIAVAARRRGRAVAVDEALLAVVRSTAGLVARGEQAATVTDRVCVQLRAVLGATSCVFDAWPGRIRGLRLEHDGSLRWGAAVWNLDQHGFPNEKVTVPARYGGELHGCFTLTPVPGTAPSARARDTAVVLAGLAAAAVAAERARRGA